METVAAVRDCIHDITEVDIRITERHDEYVNVFTPNLTEFEEDQILRTLTDSGFDPYPVTKDGHTRKILVSQPE